MHSGTRCARRVCGHSNMCVRALRHVPVTHLRLDGVLKPGFDLHSAALADDAADVVPITPVCVGHNLHSRNAPQKELYHVYGSHCTPGGMVLRVWS